MVVKYNILQETQMVGTGHWIFFLDVINGLSRKRSRGHESMEVKQKHVEERGFRSQTLAQIIVFSFNDIQKQTHPLLDHFLVPGIAALIRKSKFNFMTENMIHCWIVGE